jgi:hypothetical protein
LHLSAGVAVAFQVRHGAGVVAELEGVQAVGGRLPEDLAARCEALLEGRCSSGLFPTPFLKPVIFVLM